MRRHCRDRPSPRSHRWQRRRFRCQPRSFFALVESEQIDAATEHIDRFTARLPERRHLDGRDNGERLSADISADRVRISADRLAQRETRIDSRQTAIPYNSEARQSAASLALARVGGTRATRRRAARSAPTRSIRGRTPTLSENPPDPAGLAGRPRRARPPPPISIRRTAPCAVPAAAIELHDSYEALCRGRLRRRRRFNFFGSRDWSIDSFLYSRPIADNWRVFAHNFSASADFEGDNQTWIRSGAGIEWRQKDGV